MNFENKIVIFSRKIFAMGPVEDFYDDRLAVRLRHECFVDFSDVIQHENKVWAKVTTSDKQPIAGWAVVHMQPNSRPHCADL